jgi:hypothetical protein
MERIARREAHPQVRREAQARRGSAPKRLAQKQKKEGNEKNAKVKIFL